MKWNSIKPHDRVFIISLAVLSVVYSTIVVTVYIFFDSFALSRTAESYVLATRALAKTVSQEVGRGNYRVAYSMLYSAKSDLSIELFIIKIDGKIVYSFPDQSQLPEKTIDTERVRDSAIIQTNFGKQILVVTEPLIGSRKDSQLIIHYDFSKIQELKKLIIGIVSLSSLAGVVVIGGLFFFLRSKIKGLFDIFNESVIAIVKEESYEIPGIMSDQYYGAISALRDFRQKLKDLEIKVIDESRSAAAARVYQNLSHDMRAPIGVFERLLLAKTEDIPQILPSIKQSVSRLYMMVEAIRNGDDDSIIRKTFCALSFAYGYESLLAKSDSRNVKLIVPNQDIASVCIDLPKVERSWINLASNAIDVAKSQVVVETNIEGQALVIRVIDDGPGVPDEFLPRLFQRGATHGKPDGTGLGLAYVRQIMRGHGGDVTYRREGGLTIFECHLPNAVETEREEVVENSAVLELQLVQKLVRTVAICLEPEQLSKSVMAKLTSYKTDEFLFSGDREGANIVVSNIDEIMFDVLEGDEQEFIHVTHNWGNDEAIVAKLRLKFNLD